MTGRLRHGQRVLLVIEDDPDTASMLSMYFAGQDYKLVVAARGDEGITAARQQLPDLILLDVILPDIDGYVVCQRLRASPRTSHIPIIFLSEKASLSERVAGLGAGAQDYVTKPFDLEELRLRIKNLIARSLHDNLVDPRTNLPTGPWLEEQVQRARERPGWHVLVARIEGFRPFVDQYGFVAGDEVLNFTSRLLADVADKLGTAEDIVGQPAQTSFLILTGAADPAALAGELQTRFKTDVPAHYSFMDREQGFMLLRSASGQMEPAPLMTLQVSVREQQ
jgi:PleD family two-component response regulator